MAIETPIDTLRNQIDILTDQILRYKAKIQEERERIDSGRELLKEKEIYYSAVAKRCGESIDLYEGAIKGTLESVKEYEIAINRLTQQNEK